MRGSAPTPAADQPEQTCETVQCAIAEEPEAKVFASGLRVDLVGPPAEVGNAVDDLAHDLLVERLISTMRWATNVGSSEAHWNLTTFPTSHSLVGTGLTTTIVPGSLTGCIEPVRLAMGHRAEGLGDDEEERRQEQREEQQAPGH